MSDDITEDLFAPEPEVWCRHLLLCRSVWFDHRQPERGFSLGGVYAHLPPPDEYPLVLDRPFVYFQLFGDPGEYVPRIRLVRIEEAGYDEGEEEVQLGEDDAPLEYAMPSPRPVSVSRLSYVDEFAFQIGPVVFPEPGVYEFQLWIDGFDYAAGRERIKIGGYGS